MAPAEPVPPAEPASRPRLPHRARALVVGVVAAGVLALVLFGFVGVGSNTTTTPGVGVGSVAPDFTLPSVLAGPPVHLDGLGADRRVPVVLNFFASWCGPCQQETPLLARTAKLAAADHAKVQFVGVDVNDPTDGASFVRSSGIAYPVGADTTLRVTSALYALNNQPNTFFIDASGHVIGHVIGALTPSTLTMWLHRLSVPVQAA